MKPVTMLLVLGYTIIVSLVSMGIGFVIGARFLEDKDDLPWED